MICKMTKMYALQDTPFGTESRDPVQSFEPSFSTPCQAPNEKRKLRGFVRVAFTPVCPLSVPCVGKRKLASTRGWSKETLCGLPKAYPNLDFLGIQPAYLSVYAMQPVSPSVCMIGTRTYNVQAAVTPNRLHVTSRYDGSSISKGRLGLSSFKYSVGQ